MTHRTASQSDPAHLNSGVSRRFIVKGAAWSVPVVSLAVAAPSAAASPTALRLAGDCPRRSFTLTASPTGEIPTGTIIEAVGSGGLVATALVGGTVAGVAAQVSTKSKTVTFTLTSPISAGNTAEFAVIVRASAGRLEGSVLLPAGADPGAGAKTTGWIDWTATSCSDG